MRKFSVIAALVIGFVAVSCVGVIAIGKWAGVGIPFLSDSCRVFGDRNVVKLTPEQLANAATITLTGQRLGMPPRAVTVALATAFQESKLRNLTGGDRDSLGLFQQRPSQGWGTSHQLRQPRYAAEKFYDGLQRVPDWQQMRVTDAAQAVQLSAHPQAYQQWENDARTVAAALLGQYHAAVTCKLREKGGLSGGRAVDKIESEYAADHDGLDLPLASDGGLGFTVSADPRSEVGWRTAHWFVAKSRDYGVRSVAFAGKVWTADTGKWAVENKPTNEISIHIARS